MPRYQLIVEYDGSPFVGWQRQADGASIQGALEAAVTAFSGETAPVSGAGRTDAGVHACGQSAHLDLVRDWPADTVRDALNAHLNPLPIAVVSVRLVDDGFDARFSARARHYRYAILNRRAPPALDAGQVWHVARPLDVDTMHAAAQALTGTHDFTTFRAAQCQAKSPVKSLDRLDVARDGECVVVAASARSFLHTQVRSLVGSLKLVGEGRWTRGDLVVALEARDRRACGPVAPAQGLCLVRVDY